MYFGEILFQEMVAPLAPALPHRVAWAVSAFPVNSLQFIRYTQLSQTGHLSGGVEPPGGMSLYPIPPENPS